jgi:hypothetical protein
MYQIEVKRHLVANAFNPADGWNVTVHLDQMELANGGQHAPEKRAIAVECKQWLAEHGVTLSAHDIYGPADLVAKHPTHGTHIIEVEGDSSRQREQSLYSAFGQVVTTMGNLPAGISFGIAFPDSPEWQRQAQKMPAEVCRRLNLLIWLVSASASRNFQPE